MSEFRLYNTMSRAIEPFVPADGTTVRMYTCGPTVYNPAHLGNFRTFLFEDLMRRVLRLRGWRVEQVMNLTDVDDKIIKRAVAQGKSITEITEPVTEVFHADRRWLRIEDAEHYPKATEFIAEQIALVETLIAQGVAYQAEDGSVYFAIDRFPGYGRLSRLDTREIKAGARVAQDDYAKENAQDFALWKAAKPEDEACGAAWDSPWGRGRPGWHLECSAMAMSLLGETLDIHCGGIDLVFPHHEDEIAQSEAATGRPFVRHWLHVAHLLVDGGKMSKSLGNLHTLDDVVARGHTPMELRFALLSGHYRQPLNFTWQTLAAGRAALARIARLLARHPAAAEPAFAPGRALDYGPFAPAAAALADDLNTPRALGEMFVALDALERASPDVQAAGVPGLRALLLTLGLTPPPAPSDGVEIAAPAEVYALAQARLAARARRDWAEADVLRQRLAAAGWTVRDTADGFALSPAPKPVSASSSVSANSAPPAP